MQTAPIQTRPSANAIETAAEIIGCEPSVVRAVLRVEAAGQALDGNGQPILRFEPHHMPREHWDDLLFKPDGRAPWRASLALKTDQRKAMLQEALKLDAELAYRASSMGAPQIMGFNHEAAGFDSATAMFEAFASIDTQIEAFAKLIVAWGIDKALRAHDWRAFAARYNGNGQADVYAGRLARAHREISGRPSLEVLSLGARGQSVIAAQERLIAAGHTINLDGAFGPETKAAVMAFQESENIEVDGVIGAITWRHLEATATLAAAVLDASPLAQDEDVQRLVRLLGRDGVLASVGAMVLGYVQIMAGAPLYVQIVAGVVLAALVGFMGFKMWRQTRQPGQALA